MPTTFALTEIAVALSLLAILVLVSATLRRRIPFLRSLFIPNAIVAGVLGSFFAFIIYLARKQREALAEARVEAKGSQPPARP